MRGLRIIKKHFIVVWYCNGGYLDFLNTFRIFLNDVFPNNVYNET